MMQTKALKKLGKKEVHKSHPESFRDGVPGEEKPN
jgi:hypothetical protein